ncbi:MAG TPA: hypothetical protein VF258_01440 [Luteolibacter sp.]
MSTRLTSLRPALLAAAHLATSGASFGETAAAPNPPPLPFVANMVHHNPGEPPFVTKYNDPAWLKAQGWNAQVAKTFPQCAITWDAFDAEVMPAGSPQRAFAEKLGQDIDGQITAARAAGMPLLIFTDFLVVPRTLYTKYGKEMSVIDDLPHVVQPHEKTTAAAPKQSIAEAGTLKGSGRRFSILQPVTQRIVREQVDQIFKRFPGLDGIVLRFGETYLQDAPFHTGGSPVYSVEEHRTLITLLREEICVKRGKRLIYRTWSFGNGFHNNPDFYQQVTDAIEPHPLLAFSTKHTQGDYTRDKPFNPTLGIGKHPQMVEVSANQAGLYGKCAWPYYCAPGVIDGFANFGEAKKGIASLVGKPQFAGLWTWSQGDGWAGPYKTSEFWTDINTTVLREYARHPGRPEPAIFAQYCRETLHLDARQTELLRKLLLLATDATYHGQESDLLRGDDGAFQFTSWWCRDEYLTAVNVDAMIQPGLAGKAMAEKDKAVADWKRVEAMAKELNLANPADQEFVEVSCAYGRIRIEICREIWAMQLLEAQTRLSGSSLDKTTMRESIARYDARWAEWRKLKADHACCPTLYRDDIAVHCGPPFAQILAGYRKQVE